MRPQHVPLAQGGTAVAVPAGTGPAAGRPRILVSGLASDSHTWNLIYLQLLVEELGYPVTNLGACVPDELLVAECLRLQPDLIVLSSVNGHGFQDGSRVIRALRSVPELAATPAVIGGKLGTDGPDAARAGELAQAGFDAVFEDGAAGVLAFESLVRALPLRTAP